MKHLSTWELAFLAVGAAVIGYQGYRLYRAGAQQTAPAPTGCPPGTAYASTYDATREMYSGSCKPIGG